MGVFLRVNTSGGMKMKLLRPWVAGVGLCLSAGTASAVDVVELDFETSIHEVALGNTLLSEGVTFDFGPTAAVAYGNGFTFPESVLFSGAPSPFGTTVGTLSTRVMSSAGEHSPPPLTESFSVLRYGAGIDLATLSFSYSSEQVTKVETFDLNGSFIAGASIEIARQSQTGGCSNQVEHRFCNWTQVQGLGTGTAYSLKFYNDAGLTTGGGGGANEPTLTLYDNIRFQSAPVIPEPSTYAMMALGLACIGMFLRRRRQ
ncbi:MAG: PEP-CTERM sorting domain-containing protein [Burkholderiaceae bacterium]